MDSYIINAPNYHKFNSALESMTALAKLSFGARIDGVREGCDAVIRVVATDVDLYKEGLEKFMNALQLVDAFDVVALNEETVLITMTVRDAYVPIELAC